MNFQRIMRIILWGMAAAFLAALALNDVRLNKTITVSADTTHNRTTRYVSSFGPSPRVEIRENGIAFVGEPVYVNVRLPRWFDKAVFELRYSAAQELPVRFGVRTNPEIWQFDVKTIASGSDESLTVHSDVKMLDDGQVRIPFTLDRSWQVERNVYRFIFSIPGASEKTPLIIHNFRITAKREPICLVGFCL